MRAIVFAISLAACATAPTTAEHFELAGCWANRADARVEQMIWRQVATGLEGELLAFNQGDTGAPRQNFTLTQAAEGWRLCEAGASAQTCWRVAHERAGSLEGGRAFVDRYGDRLRIGVVAADGAERKIFEGQREACPA